MGATSEAGGLGEEECRAVFRLVHELCELGNDPVQWNTHLLQGLETLTAADHGIAYVIRRDMDPADIAFTLYLDHNLDESWSQYLDAKGVSEQPHTPAMMARLGTDFTVPRQEIINDATWYASDFYRNVATKVDWDQAIFSQIFIAARGLVHGLAMMRRVGRPAFEPREIGITRLLHSELAHLWRKPEAVEIDELPSRLRETVSGMRRGLGRKEIADELAISPHTVHTYERQLFEKFAVNSRGELLARLARAIRPTLPK